VADTIKANQNTRFFDPLYAPSKEAPYSLDLIKRGENDDTASKSFKNIKISIQTYIP
jgi:hypothetical protein